MDNTVMVLTLGILLGFIAGIILCIAIAKPSARRSMDDIPSIPLVVRGRPDNKKARSHMTPEYRTAMMESIQRERMKRNASVPRNPNH